eukprot:gb/GECG01001011.1/.p1 GENE.gb/GECG01001011.1/~~gb/GECG01001011.1/.p1  ORF type:complete len:454 (+),score=61.78 gb/GECG01001011.1/:1-1362(+)
MGSLQDGQPLERLNEIVKRAKERDPHLEEFHQVVDEVAESLKPVFEKHPEYLPDFERLLEPENVVNFRVPWIDDRGNSRVNRGFRVQQSHSLGPYKGGLRFHPTVNISIMKFLALEQVFKNSLTGLSLGGAKGGSDFDPKGKSEAEVMRFCQSFMTSLAKYIGPNRDVPAGDIGVGGREIGYLYGHYMRMTDHFEGAITGKSPEWGGSRLRPEATGYGIVYFLKAMLDTAGTDFKSIRVALSGSGNVASFAAEKVLELGGSVVSLSDSNGFLHFPDGITRQQLDQINHLKQVKRERLSSFPTTDSAKYYPSEKPWQKIDCEVAMPCATQNEIGKTEAEALVSRGVKFVVEGANMPLKSDATSIFRRNGIPLAPAKAANAGGVAVSGLEMAQNSSREQWGREEVDERLKQIMKSIYQQCRKAAEEYGHSGDLLSGSNIAAFLRVADAMHSQGCV